MVCSIDGCGSRAFCRGWCSKHYSRWQRKGDPLALSRQDRPRGEPDELWCPACSQFKSERLFGSRSAQAEARRKSLCRECERAYHRSRRAENPEARKAHREASRQYARSQRNRELRLAKLYDITVSDYDAMVIEQDGRCAICSACEPGGNAAYWHVDHDHTTGRVRGLLCARCNIGLGYFQDDPERLVRASAYLGAMTSA